MTTSANSIEYTISRNGKSVGSFSRNIMCSKPDPAELLKYHPLSEHSIQAWGYDEEEDDWYDEPENLEVYLKKMIPFNKKIKSYFSGEKTVDQIGKELEEERKEDVRKMREHFNKEREKIRNQNLGK